MREQQDRWYNGKREGGLLRFAIAITILNVLGHTVLGFEQAWATPFMALAAAYGMELSCEAVACWSQRAPLHFLQSPRTFALFLLPAHITGLAVGMLLYAADRFWVVGFAAAAAIASKRLFTVTKTSKHQPVGRTRHFLNPSNFGISLTLVLFPSVGIAPPYQFTENVRGVFDVVLPLIIVVTGSFLNARFTERMPLIVAWLAGFVLQAALRSVWLGTPVLAAMVPVTGLAFVLFTFYMVTDPGTTPTGWRSQVLFGLGVAACYGLLVSLHVAFGLFFALAVVTALRGAAMSLGVRWADVILLRRPVADLRATGEAILR